MVKKSKQKKSGRKASGAKRSTQSKRLVLLDAHAIIHRAYHALPDFTSPSGEPTGALYGLVAMLLKLVKDLKPDYIVAAYDLPEPTERHRAFSEYKAGRAGIDEALVQQLERSRAVLEALSIPIYDKPGFEADDIIGTIVDKTSGGKNLEVVIASGDMDTLQLISGTRVRVYTLKKGIRDTILYDEQAVKERFGFSPELLPDYKGLRGDPSDNIPGVPGIGEKTATELVAQLGGIDDIYQSVVKGKEAVLKGGVKERTVKLLLEHEDEARFSRELAEIRRDAPIGFALPKHTWFDSVDTGRVLDLFSELGFRTLATRVRELFHVQIENGGPIAAAPDDATEREVLEAGIALWVLNSEYTNPTPADILSYTKQRTVSQARAALERELAKQKLANVFKDIELPLVPVVERMRARGVRVDVAYLKVLSKRYHKKLDELAREIYGHAGEEFNINSPRQLGNILYTKLGLSGSARTATGQRSTRESELDKLRGKHPVADAVLAYRELQKLLSTYIDVLPVLVSPSDGRLHTEFLQTGTTTGRLASRNPNLQNIPIRTELGRSVRRAFVAASGFVLADLDYSQIELRVSAAITGDEKMRGIFLSGGDIHTEVAREVFGSDDAEARRRAKTINFGIHYGMGVNALAHATGTSRAEARAFLDAYFERFPGVAMHIEAAKRFVHQHGYTETLFGRRRYFPGIRSHLPYVRAEAERMAINAPIQGSSADIIKLAMHAIDDFLEREGLRSDAYLVLQIHDELLFEVRASRAEALARKLRALMEHVVSSEKLRGVPLVASASIGENWDELAKLS